MGSERLIDEEYRGDDVRSISIIAFIGLLVSCSEDSGDTVCVQGEVQICPCVGGGEGVQECAEDRQGWVSCRCAADEDEREGDSGAAGGMTGGSDEMGGTGGAAGSSGTGGAAGSGGAGGTAGSSGGSTGSGGTAGQGGVAGQGGMGGIPSHLADTDVFRPDRDAGIPDGESTQQTHQVLPDYSRLMWPTHRRIRWTLHAQTGSMLTRIHGHRPGRHRGPTGGLKRG